jgi:hypothetical protein
MDRPTLISEPADTMCLIDSVVTKQLEHGHVASPAPREELQR